MRSFIKKNILNSLIRVLIRLLRNLSSSFSGFFVFFQKERCHQTFCAEQCHRNNMNKNVKLIDHNSLIASTVNESYRKKFDFYETTRVKLTKNYFKFKWIFFCVFLIVLYVSLNNYLIIFIYMKPVHSVTSDTSDVNNKYSFLHYLFNRVSLFNSDYLIIYLNIILSMILMLH